MRLIKLWKLMVPLGLILCLAILFRLTIKRDNSITLTFGMFAGSYWDVPTGNCYAIIDAAIERFEEEYPGVTIEYQSGILKNDYSEWFSGLLLEDKEPDVFMVLSDDFEIFASNGVLMNLDSFISKDSTMDIEDFYESALKYGRYQDQTQYALPYEGVPTLMFVNKTLLKNEGISLPDNTWSWDDFYNICSQVTKDTDLDGSLDQFGYYGYSWKHAAYANGIQLFDEDGTESFFASSEMEETILFMRKLTALGKGNLVTSKDFDSGKVAFCPLQFPEYRTYKPYPWRIKKYTSFEWECIKLPAGPSGGNISELDTLLIGISANTKEKNLAWEFLKMLTYDEEIQKMIFTDSQGVSVNKNVTQSKETVEILKLDGLGESSMDMTFLTEVMENSVAIPKFRKYQEAMDLAEGEITNIILSDKNIENALLEVQRKINKYLDN